MNSVVKDSVYKDCPIRNVLTRICDKWSLLVIYTLKQSSTMRFSTLRKHIPDVSQKMLTSTLRVLEADGYVTRQVYAEVPPRVEYTLTETGYSLKPILDSMWAWGLDYKAKNGE